MTILDNVLNMLKKRALNGALVIVRCHTEKGWIFLIIKSKSAKKYHFPSGTTAIWETTLSSAKRELFEETKLITKLKDTNKTYRFRYPQLPFHPACVQQVYLAEITNINEPAASHEIETLKWVTKEEMKPYLFPSLYYWFNENYKLL